MTKDIHAFLNYIILKDFKKIFKRKNHPNWIKHKIPQMSTKKYSQSKTENKNNYLTNTCLPL